MLVELGLDLLELDMDAISKADQNQTYWLLFQKMKDDFVHQKDLSTILNTTTIQATTMVNVVGSMGPSTGAGSVVLSSLLWTPTTVAAESTAATYKASAEGNKKAREKLIEGAETAVEKAGG